ncbi:MAG: efflux RND transporter periplasmic adaptor subunit [Pseudomonadota bacterium]
MKNALIIIGILVGAIVLTVLLMGTSKRPDKAEPEKLIPLVEVMELSAETVTFQIPSRGTVTPLIDTQLSAEVSGAVTSVSPNFIAGGVFKQGDALAVIDPVVYRATVKRAEAALKQREIEYEGIKKLGAKGYRSEVELASAEAGLETAKAELVSARRNLERTVIRAPFDGMVRVRSIDIGQFVNIGTPIGQIFGTDVAEIRLPLSESELGFVRLPGAASLVDGESVEPVAVTLRGTYRGKPAEWRAEIVRTEGVVDDSNRVTWAVARIRDPYALADDASDRVPLPIGTFTNAGISGVTVSDIYKVPQYLVRGNDRLLLVDGNNELRIRTADIVRVDTEYAYVLAESIPENVLVLTSLEAPLNGSPVRLLGDAIEDERSTEPMTLSGEAK